jgi:hypothetical protein
MKSIRPNDQAFMVWGLDRGPEWFTSHPVIDLRLLAFIRGQ